MRCIKWQCRYLHYSYRPVRPDSEACWQYGWLGSLSFRTCLFIFKLYEGLTSICFLSAGRTGRREAGRQTRNTSRYAKSARRANFRVGRFSFVRDLPGIDSSTCNSEVFANRVREIRLRANNRSYKMGEALSYRDILIFKTVFYVYKFQTLFNKK